MDEVMFEDAPASEPVSERDGGWRRWLHLVVSTFSFVGDVGLLVLGSGLIGLAAVTLLDGFGVIDLALSDSAGAMLGSGLVIGILGAFALGVAAEGPIGHSHRRWTYNDTELAVARAIALVIVGLVFAWGATKALDLAGELPLALGIGIEFLRATARAAYTGVIFVGVPLLVLLPRIRLAPWWVEEIESPVLYLVWAITAAILF